MLGGRSPIASVSGLYLMLRQSLCRWHPLAYSHYGTALRGAAWPPNYDCIAPKGTETTIPRENPQCFGATQAEAGAAEFQGIGLFFKRCPDDQMTVVLGSEVIDSAEEYALGPIAHALGITIVTG